MAIITATNKIDLKGRVINKIGSALTKKINILGSDTIYFNEKVGVYSCILMDRGYPYLLTEYGTKTFPRGINGNMLMKMLKQIMDNNVYAIRKSDSGTGNFIVRVKNV